MDTNLSESPTREEIMEFLFESSSYGNLGLFVGAGFSRAVVDTEQKQIALGWGQLLENASKKMKVSFAKLKQEGSGFPDLASKLCVAHAKKTKGTPSKSLLELKRIISSSTAWYPQEDKRAQFSEYLHELGPSWIITTNYDQVIESLLPGTSFSLGPNDSFVSRSDLTPIFHLHGVRTNPTELIISQEDYVSLFRPNEYRQIRLALALKESATCLLGYNLGDVNVLTALDWSSKVFKREDASYPREVIQVLRKSDRAASKPHRLENGIVVVEVGEIADFFKEYIEALPRWKNRRKKRDSKLKQILKIFREANSDDVREFLENGKWRRQILGSLPKYKVEFVAEFEKFLRAATELNRHESGKNGAFHEYAKGLAMNIDMLCTFSSDEFPPALLAAVVRNLDRLANYIGEERGNSFSASRLWSERKGELSSEMVAELRAVAACNGHTRLSELIRKL